jgi:serine/threonine protein kinase
VIYAMQCNANLTVASYAVHYQGIIHRDIKPANLLYSDPERTCVKISDFGVSHLSDALAQIDEVAEQALTERALRKTAGSPAFFAPELCYSSDYTPKATPDDEQVAGPHNYFGSDEDASARPAYVRQGASSRSVASISKPSAGFFKDRRSRNGKAPPIGKAIDVWALGVTLYCMLFGHPPFNAVTEYALYNVIPYEEAPIPETMGCDRRPTESVEGKEVIDLLGRLLEKDPTKRITLSEVKVGFRCRS